jgi:hypothetical protein
MIKLILKNTTWPMPEPEAELEPEPELDPEPEPEAENEPEPKPTLGPETGSDPESEPEPEPEPEPESESEPQRDFEREAGGMDIPSMLTLLLTTSPVQSNPSTELLEGCLGSFAHVPALAGVRRIIVCDGCRETEAISGKRGFRSGWVTAPGARRYSDFKMKLRELTANAAAGDDKAALWKDTEILELNERSGFGFAVKAALPHVRTEYVIVVQHDRFFMRPLDLHPLLRAMVLDPVDINCIYLATSNVSDYAHRTRSGRFRCADGSPIELMNHAKNPDGCGLDAPGLLPMLIWLDSTHIARTQWYSEYVFKTDPPVLVARGGFIEDKLGQQQAKWLEEEGFEAAHARYKTYILPEPPLSAQELKALHSDRSGEDSLQQRAAGKGTRMSFYYRIQSGSRVAC